MPAVTDEIGVVMAESTREVMGVSPPDMVARSMNAASNMNTGRQDLEFCALKEIPHACTSFRLGTIPPVNLCQKAPDKTKHYFALPK